MNKSKRNKHPQRPRVGFSGPSFEMVETEYGYEKRKTDRVIGDFVLHPTKGWRKISTVNMYAYQNKLMNFIQRGMSK